MKKLNTIINARIAKLSFAVAMVAAPCMLQAQAPAANLIKNGGAETGDISGWSGFASTSDKAQEGTKSFVLKPNGAAISADVIEVDPKARYELSGFMVAEEGSGTCHFGFRPLDADKKQILSEQITMLKGTETKLREAATKGATVLKIENGQAWVFDEKWTPQFGCVAFNVDDSGAFADLPNRNLSILGIKAIRQADGQWEVELANPLSADFAAGTKVRQHRAQGGAVWVESKTVADQWVSFKGIRSGVSTTGQESGKFCPGTKYIKVSVFNNSNSNVLVDNVVLRRVE
jgi:hypothetical protein